MPSAPDVRIPKTMKAAVIDRFGGPDVIHTEDLPVPDLGDDEVLIRVETAGVGVWDPGILDGSLDEGGPFPRVIGADGAGVVVGMGRKARRFKVGDRVYAWGFGNPKGGFYAEYAAVREQNAAPIPKTMKIDEAGALAADGLTALEGLEQLQIKKGQALVILGASGGVGHIALQLAKRLGARVFAVASGNDGIGLVHRLGADGDADGHGGDVAAAARAFAPDGFDAALVLTGGEGLVEVLTLVKKGGRIRYPNGVSPEPNAPSGVDLKSFDPATDRHAFDRLNRLIAMGPFRVELSHVYPLEEVADALRAVTQHHLGKVVLRIHTS